VKLLLDQNLSPRLIERLSADFPESTHVHRVGLDRAPDDEVWNYAKNGGFIIVTKDSDFHERSVLHGPPPKIVWIRRGNCSTEQIEQILIRHLGDIQTLAADPGAAFLILI
jgi:predicted nuclease of predicted toxin-antitoxin system